MDKEKFLIEKMEEYRRVANNKDSIDLMLNELLKEKFPSVVSSWFSDTVIEITTEKHTMRKSRWGTPPEEPEFVCDKPKIPETIEEFQELKEFLDNDKQQCLDAFNWLDSIYKVD